MNFLLTHARAVVAYVVCAAVTVAAVSVLTAGPSSAEPRFVAASAEQGVVARPKEKPKDKPAEKPKEKPKEKPSDKPSGGGSGGGSNQERKCRTERYQCGTEKRCFDGDNKNCIDVPKFCSREVCQ